MSDEKSYAEFDFDLARAVLDQLVEAFELLPIGELRPEHLAEMKSGQGVYQLFLGGALMYIGKTDKGLRGRLERHYRMLSARQNIAINELGFKALYIHRNWLEAIPSTMLNERFQSRVEIDGSFLDE